MKKILLIGILLLSLIEANEMTKKLCEDLAQQAVDMRGAGERKKANEFLIKACNNGCGLACAYEDKADRKAACAAKIPDGLSCAILADNELDEEKKLKSRQVACEKGYGNGCLFLAYEYAQEKNYGYAIKYYKIGCDLGNEEACGTLAIAYETGKFGDIDHKKAYEYFTKSLKINPNNKAYKHNLNIICSQNPSACK